MNKLVKLSDLAQMFSGALTLRGAFLPHMRARKSGTVVWFGSVGGWRELAGGGLYSATKYCVRGMF